MSEFQTVGPRYPAPPHGLYLRRLDLRRLDLPCPISDGGLRTE